MTAKPKLLEFAYVSLFAGIGGIDLACDRAGMQAAAQVEINADCQKVLAHHWPDVPKFTDVKAFDGTAITIRPDLVCGGVPCQDFSVAGLRAGLAGERSGLFWQFHRIIGELRPRWFLFENVPGLLSSNGGRDMRAITDAMGQLGYGWAMRVLDAQWFGVPQRRRRVFIVGCLGDWRRAAEILFEPESLPWDSPPRRKTGARVAASITSGSKSGSGVNSPGRRREDDVNLALARCVTAREGQRMGCDQDTYITHALTGEGHDASEDGTGRGTPSIETDTARALDTSGPEGNQGGTVIALPFDERNVTSPDNRSNPKFGSECHTLHEKAPAVAIQERACSESDTSGPGGKGYQANIAYTLEARHHTQSVQNSMQVRRLLPVECLRLQGFPDDWLDDLELSDSAKYRMCGNSVAVPVIEWIVGRIRASS